MMRQIAAIRLYDPATDIRTLTLSDQEFEIHTLSAGGDATRAEELVREWAGKADAIALRDMPLRLQAGKVSIEPEAGQALRQAAGDTPLVDGQRVISTWGRWALKEASDSHSGLLKYQRIFVLSGLRDYPLVPVLQAYSHSVSFGDPALLLNLPWAIHSPERLEQIAGTVAPALSRIPYALLTPDGQPEARAEELFHKSDILVGSAQALRHFAPARLERKTIITRGLEPDDVEDFRGRGVETLVALAPRLGSTEGQAGIITGPEELEAMLLLLSGRPAGEVTNDDLLNLASALSWQPTVEHLQGQPEEIGRFAFIIHPLRTEDIFKDRRLRLLRWVPAPILERLVAEVPPLYLSRVTGIRSEATGRRVEGWLISLGGTPKQLMRLPPSHTYRRLIAASRLGQRLGARIMGLGAFTSVVGDAGITVAQKADIAVTSGNSLTVAATLEAAKQAVQMMGATDLTHGKAMVIGATGSIGAVCSRLLAQAIGDVVLVAPRPEKLIELKLLIESETPEARITIATKPDEFVGEADLVVTTTSALTGRVLDVTKLKPGAVVCDVARPPDVREEDAALRPDVLVIESGEIRLPGDPDFGFDIGLPPKTAYACLAETALLAMEGIYEDYTLGREIEMERVKEMYRLFKKHGLRLAGLRTFGRYISDEDVARKRALADELRRDPEKLRQIQEQARARIKARRAPLPASPRLNWKGVAAAGAIGGLGYWLVRHRDGRR